MIYITAYPLTQRINPMDRIIRAVAAALVVGLVGSAAAQQTGTFTDGRDGQKYKTVKIGTQTWMAQNINYQTESGSWCYNDSASYCKQYGRLYNWKTATTVCPKGWKLPSNEDWNRLVATAGGWETASQKLKSKSGWNKNGNGTDDYGFSALPGGGRDSDGGFGDAGYGGGWWSASENSVDYAYNRGMYYDDGSVIEGYGYKSGAFSARCVQDSE
jgi:uncharacterized protein (TIGR02145 family)